MAWWLGIVIGTGVMVAHTLLRVFTHRWAVHRTDGQAFLLFELGGLGVRMTLVLSAVGLVLAFVPVHEAAFVGTVLLLLLLSMAVEIRFVMRQVDRGALDQ
jgi:hypothetical protein